MIMKTTFLNLAELVLVSSTLVAFNSSGQPITNCAARPSGLIAWWSGDGNALDFAGTNHGTLMNGATFASGKAGQAFSFDGLDDHVRVPDAPVLNPTQQISIVAWVFPTAELSGSGGTSIIVNKENDLVTQYELCRMSRATWCVGPGIPSGNMAFYLGGLAGLPNECSAWVDGRASLPLDTWSHVALTFDGSAVRVYKDGIPTREIAAPGHLSVGNGDLRIGRRTLYQGTDMWGGLIDEVAIFNRALSSNEIGEIFSAGSGGMCKPSVARILAPLRSGTVVIGDVLRFSGFGSDWQRSDQVQYYWNLSGGRVSALKDPGLVSFPLAGTNLVTFDVTDRLGHHARAPESRTFSVVVATNAVPDLSILELAVCRA